MVMYSERHDSISGIISVSSFSENWKGKKKKEVHIAHMYVMHVCTSYVRSEFLGFPVEWVHDLPRGQRYDVDHHEGADDQVELVVLHHLLVQLHVGEDGVDAPSLAEHGAKAEREARHQDPGPRRAYVREGRDAGEVGVEAEQDDGGVREDAADDDEVVHVGRGHLDLALVPEPDVDSQKHGGDHNPQRGHDDDDDVQGRVHPRLHILLERPILWRPILHPLNLLALFEVQRPRDSAVFSDAALSQAAGCRQLSLSIAADSARALNLRSDDLLDQNVASATVVFEADRTLWI